MQYLEREAHLELLKGTVQGLAVSLYENETPPCGLAGTLDWYFQGAISQCLAAGRITGRPEESVYFPLTRHGTVFHLIFAGAGVAETPGLRTPLSGKTLALLSKNLQNLKLQKVGLSRSDFGLEPENCSDFLSKYFKGLPLWIAS